MKMPPPPMKKTSPKADADLARCLKTGKSRSECMREADGSKTAPPFKKKGS